MHPKRFSPNRGQHFAKCRAIEKETPRRPTKVVTELTTDEKGVLNKPKQTLTKPSAVVLSHATGYYTVNTDGCDAQVGYVLFQQRTNEPCKPVCPGFSTLKDLGKN